MNREKELNKLLLTKNEKQLLPNPDNQFQGQS